MIMENRKKEPEDYVVYGTPLEPFEDGNFFIPIVLVDLRSYCVVLQRMMWLRESQFE